MKNAALLAVLLCGANASAQIPTIDPYSDPYSQRQQQSERSMRAQAGAQYERDRAMRNDGGDYRRGYEQGRRDEARLQRAEQAQRRGRGDGQLGNINVN